METSLNPPSSSAPDALTRIEAKLDRLERRLGCLDTLIEQTPSLLAIVGDSFDEAAAEFDFDARLRAGMRVLERLTRPETLTQIERLLEVVESLPIAHARAQRLGLFGLLRELRDPDVQHAMGLAVEVARGVGHRATPRPALPTGGDA